MTFKPFSVSKILQNLYKIIKIYPAENISFLLLLLLTSDTYFILGSKWDLPTLME